MNHSADFLALSEAIALYFDGIHHSDVARLAKVFHPKAQYVCATEVPLVHRGMEEYFAIVAKRESPASRNEPRVDRIISIEFAGAVTAFARVECAIGEKFFTDMLTFVFVDNRWQIISKVFHFEVRNG
jgi:hypothetical protein